MTARLFHLGDVLSVTTGILVSPRRSAGVGDLLGFMTGDSVFDHQVSRLIGECAPALLAQHPRLAEVVAPDGFDDEASALAWLAEQVESLGEDLVIEALPAVEHTRIDPFAELAMKAPHLSVIPVVDGDR